MFLDTILTALLLSPQYEQTAVIHYYNWPFLSEFILWIHWKNFFHSHVSFNCNAHMYHFVCQCIKTDSILVLSYIWCIPWNYLKNACKSVLLFLGHLRSTFELWKIVCALSTWDDNSQCTMKFGSIPVNHRFRKYLWRWYLYVVFSM